VTLEAAKLLEIALDAIKVAGAAPAVGEPLEIRGSVVKGPEGLTTLAELAATGAAAAGAALEIAAAGAGAATEEAPATAGGPWETITAVVKVAAEVGTTCMVDAGLAAGFMAAIFGIAPAPAMFMNEPAPQRH
jgi:hypothetical protein